MIAPATATTDATPTFTRQFVEPTALTRYGDALPSVSAPTITPSAKPRPSRNQVAISFIPGGYTPARNAPVRNRSTIAGATLCTDDASTAFATAPRRPQIVMRWRA